MNSADEREGEVLGFAHLGLLNLAVPTEVAEEVIRGPIELSSLPNDSRFLQGVFSLRGLPIPVFNLREVSGEGPEGEKRLSIENAFVLQWRGHRFAIEISEIGEVARCGVEHLTRIEQGREHGIFDRLHTHPETGAVSAVIDVEAILKKDGMRSSLSVSRTSKKAQVGNSFSQNGMVVFRCGPFRFAMDCFALKWVETMPTELEQPFTSSVMLGFQRQRNSQGYLGVLDLLGVLNLGKLESEFADRALVVANLDGQELGLSVDEVLEIRHFSGLERHEVDARSLGGTDVFAGSVIDQNGGEVLLIDPAKLQQRGESMGAFSQLEVRDLNSQEEKRGDQRRHYIVYRSGESYFATLLEELDAVIEVPENWIESPRSGEGAIGMCSYLGRPVRMYELIDGSEESGRGQLLLLREKTSYIGFRVDEVSCLQWGIAENFPNAKKAHETSGPLAVKMLSISCAERSKSAAVLDLHDHLDKKRGSAVSVAQH